MGVFGFLKRFFASDDPIVKLSGGLSEPDALMQRELLDNSGVPAMVKNAGVDAAYGASSMVGFDLYVKESDVDRAREILGPMMDGEARGAPGEGNGHGDGYTR